MDRAGEEAAAVHAARRYLYALGQLLLGGEPTIERLSSADADLLPDALEVVGLPDDFGTANALADARDHVEEACALYVRLFIGPVAPKALPWESTYRSRSKALFRQETLDVRNAYRSQGLLPQAYPKVADDHIAIELGFLAALAGRALDALQVGDETARREAEEASRAFLEGHLLRWADDYAADLAKAAPGSLYASLARLMGAFARNDAALLAAF